MKQTLVIKTNREIISGRFPSIRIPAGAITLARTEDPSNGWSIAVPGSNNVMFIAGIKEKDFDLNIMDNAKNDTVSKEEFNKLCDLYMTTMTGIGLNDCTGEGNVDDFFEQGFQAKSVCEHIILKGDLTLKSEIGL